ncbi:MULTISPECIES: GntR family transcriptional regulator [Cupriavidus]|jgi:DNA-binding GntR family transcriptional regulator|uniref:GntR family transcriptional regulator n=1 Tax=Cupriavidus metallidurans TaxID=119219 RepID=A0A2L0X3M4_9BURK|nr:MULTISPECIES: GntR family transcriptional regulator [Cupriavidus]AVA34701.1 GntR family transcriptional regulator [Cupriavidus metallidurans]KWR80782.1 GntR family transcriptional regulator [Cupriavidus sp. SHE]QBP12254.1 GntR family transcriptional regulator [Cupriavidus metallidurans]QWC92219.1 GntR family transcriptional regulator [Cupriavidus metallidurans]
MERRSESTADLVAESLRELIASGEAMDGTRLVERDLAEKFGVSRIPLREALQRLESEGLVEINRNRGAVVRTLSPADVEEIYSLRMLLEGDAIYQAVKHMDDETLSRVELVHRLLGDAKSREKQGQLNREFHELLYAPCGNTRQLNSIRDLRTQVERYERLQSTLLADTKMFQREHAEILKACTDGNAKGARSMTVAHLASAKRIVEQLVRKGMP